MGPIASREPSQGALVQAIPPMFRCACGWARDIGTRDIGMRALRAAVAARPRAGSPARRPPTSPPARSAGRTPAGQQGALHGALATAALRGALAPGRSTCRPWTSWVALAARGGDTTSSPCVTRLDVATRPCGHPGRASPHVRRRRARATRAARRGPHDHEAARRGPHDHVATRGTGRRGCPRDAGGMTWPHDHVATREAGSRPSSASIRSLLRSALAAAPCASVLVRS